MMLSSPAEAQAKKPDAPTDVTVKAGNKKVAVSWKAPASDGGSPITGYVVTPFRGKTKEAPVTVNSTDTTTTVTGLVNGATYTFRVSAVNASGAGAESAASASVTPKGPGTAPWYKRKRYWAVGIALLAGIGVVLYFALHKPKKPADQSDAEPAATA
jgi:predicted phage tail protein